MQVRTENENFRSKCTQLGEVDNLALHAVLDRLHSGLRAQLNSDTTYTACVQNLADSQVRCSVTGELKCRYI